MPKLSAFISDLEAHHTRLQRRTLAALFDDAADRFDQFSAASDGLLLDYSKVLLDAPARDVLFSLFEKSGVAARRDRMLQGARINTTENRSVLHTALRLPESAELDVDGQNVVADVYQVLNAMSAFSDGVRNGQIKGAAGMAFTDVINIGIGGSDLGPVMVSAALAPDHDGPRVHFVSNVDGAHLHDTLAGLNPATTLVLVASKTFTTHETMTNAQSARRWIVAGVGEDNVGQHFAAISTNQAAVNAFGIDTSRMFGFWDWVGGRYSVWSAIGLPVMIAIGPAKFREFLAGGHAMDQHFATAPTDQNLPVLLALVGIWHRNVCGYGTHAVLPYDQRLSRFAAYLQQQDMESNGKSVQLSGAAADSATGPVIWGEPGTNGQHAFYQLIHQGTRIIPCEFMVGAESHEPALAHQHRLLISNCLAQSEALMKGRSLDEARALMAGKFDGDELERQARHRVFPGNRPSTTLVYPKLTPYVLGQIIALYEHRVFVEGVMLGINSFDQWGVELGKELARALEPVVAGDAPGADKDGSTRQLVGYVLKAQGRAS